MKRISSGNHRGIRYTTRMQKHHWREETEDGQQFFRATYYGGEWKLYSQFKDEEEWKHYEPIPTELLEKLREIVWNKYQRGRCPHKLVTKIDKMLGKE